MTWLRHRLVGGKDDRRPWLELRTGRFFVLGKKSCTVLFEKIAIHDKQDKRTYVFARRYAPGEAPRRTSFDDQQMVYPVRPCKECRDLLHEGRCKRCDCWAGSG